MLSWGKFIKQYRPFLLLAVGWLIANPFSAQAVSIEAESPRVVASLRPLHSLASMVMEGVGTPSLLLDGPQDPHHFHLRPSQMRLLKNADLVLYMDPGFELFLSEIRQSDQKYKYIALSDAAGDRLSRNDHHWLNPAAAQAMLGLIAEHLGHIDTANATHYTANAKRYRRQIAEWDSEWQKRLKATFRTELQATVAESPRDTANDSATDSPCGMCRQDMHILTDHDTFLPLTRHFGLRDMQVVKSHQGSLRVKALAEIEDLAVSCLLIHSPADDAIHTIAQKNRARIVEVDTLGVTQKPGIALYFQLMDRLVQQIAGCHTRP